MFFNGWNELQHILVVGLASYFTLILFLRMSGKRTLSSLNAFDLVVTVALGSTLASSLNNSVSYAGVALSFALLIGLQYIITWISVRSPRFDSWIKAQPMLVYHQGQFLDKVMCRERLTREEILSAARTQGLTNLDDVEAVVLETNAQLTCLRKWVSTKPEAFKESDRTTLTGVGSSKSNKSEDLVN